MDEGTVLGALGDPTRRSVFELLATGGPQPVGAIAERLPISRPAVSQHLKVLADAGLVRSEARGTRRIYRLDASGLGALRTWLDSHWDGVLDRFEQAAERRYAEMDVTGAPAPVVKQRVVRLEQVEAFALFTARMGQWWPLATHSIGGEAVTEIRFEGRVGGRVVEIHAGGTEHSWADILAWDPPHRFVLSWHPTLEPVAASRVEVRFRPVAGGTEVYLVHDGWHEFGAEAAALRDNYDSGWEPVLDGFEHAAR